MMLAVVEAHASKGGKYLATVRVGHERRPEWGVVGGESVGDGEYLFPMVLFR